MVLYDYMISQDYSLNNGIYIFDIPHKLIFLVRIVLADRERIFRVRMRAHSAKGRFQTNLLKVEQSLRFPFTSSQ